jgi:alkanesulfonate monooxygenase SsuD/methylene tetrahydromethanopterin reductase-like flavin-dependent oxidoreductase (luciferase family)
MKLGFALPNIGPIATAEAVSKVAQRAEGLGYDSLWTVERLLYPVKPLGKEPGKKDERSIFSGTVDQIQQDVAGCARIGARELFFDPRFSKGGQSVERWLLLMEEIRGWV